MLHLAQGPGPALGASPGRRPWPKSGEWSLACALDIYHSQILKASWFANRPCLLTGQHWFLTTVLLLPFVSQIFISLQVKA